MTDEPQPAPDRPATTAEAFLQAERLRRTPVHQQPAPDRPAISGAVFAREVGADPEKWAREFLAAYAAAEGVRTDADRLAFVTQWFRDAMRAVVGSELMAHWKRDPVSAMREAQKGADDDNRDPGMRA